MVNKTTISITACFFGSIAFVLFLQGIAAGPNNNKNHFIRVFPPHFFRTSRTIDLKNPSYYIAGITRGSIYLGNYGDASVLSEISWKADHRHDFRIPEVGQKITIPSASHLSIDSPWFFLNNYLFGTVFRGRLALPEDSLAKLAMPPGSTSIFIPISSGSFAIRRFDQTLKENVLGKLWTNAVHVGMWPDLLEKQGDGIFSTDGLLESDPVSGKFVYVYFYRNQFLCLDSNLLLTYRGHTIDTTAHAKIRVVTIPSQAATSIASPGFRVNRAACISADWIFIHSDLRADNEEENIFNENRVIDVYSMSDGRYHFSFYLPKLSGNITDMAISQRMLAVLQDHWLTTYNLNMDEIKNLLHP